MHSGEHLSHDALSAFIDEQLTPHEAAAARAHLGTCSDCQQRLDALRTVVGYLRALPSVVLPRDFRLGPRLVIDPPGVVRLRRWYGAARVGAASLAAAFVFLSAGTLYVESRPPVLLASQSPASEAAGESGAAAPATTLQNPVPPPPQAGAIAAPAAARAVAPRAQAAPSPASADAADQVAAATTVRPLPTLVPTPPPPTPVVTAAPKPAIASADPAAPLRVAATTTGLLSALAVIAVFIIRRRLHVAAHFSQE